MNLENDATNGLHYRSRPLAAKCYEEVTNFVVTCYEDVSDLLRGSYEETGEPRWFDLLWRP